MKYKLLMAALKKLSEDDERDNSQIMLAILTPIVFFIVLILLTAYILLTPMNSFAHIFMPQEAAAAQNFKEQYDYILQDLVEYGGYSLSDTNGLGTKIEISTEELAALMTGLDIPEDKHIMIENALSLVGKVDYFWGGKSKAGWNDAWGEPRKVTAAGSKNTGKIMPYGLDCSGFVDWVYKTSGYDNLMNGGVAFQWGQCCEVKEENLQVGDLVFQSPPNKSGINHIGIYLGEREGKHLFVHCAGGQGVVINSWSGFIYFRRPII